jgi:transcriptional regulator with XRE-family HTH domain
LNPAKLRRLRIIAGDSQGTFAERIGMYKETYRRIEAGITTRPHPKNLRKIADGLGVPVDDILLADDEPAAAAQ